MRQPAIITTTKTAIALVQSIMTMKRAAVIAVADAVTNLESK